MKKQTLFLVGTFILIVWYYLAYMLYGLEPGHSDELRSEKTAKKVKKILVRRVVLLLLLNNQRIWRLIVTLFSFLSG